MNQQAVVTSAAPVDWGPWQSVMDDVIRRCGGYLLEVERSMKGEVLRDRADFRELAACLFDAADELVERCDDVERWVGKWQGGS